MQTIAEYSWFSNEIFQLEFLNYSPFIVCVQNSNQRTWNILNQRIWNRGRWSKFCSFLSTTCFIEICYVAKSIVSGLVLINRQLCALVQPRCGHHHQQPLLCRRLWQFWLWSFQWGPNLQKTWSLCKIIFGILTCFHLTIFFW